MYGSGCLEDWIRQCAAMKQETHSVNRTINYELRRSYQSQSDEPSAEANTCCIIAGSVAVVKLYLLWVHTDEQYERDGALGVDWPTNILGHHHEPSFEIHSPSLYIHSFAIIILMKEQASQKIRISADATTPAGKTHRKEILDMWVRDPLLEHVILIQE
jgi:hypothetical protein